MKGEVGGCDLVGLSGAEPPVVVVCELKLSFNLELLLQAVDRAAMSDEVWVAARVSAKGRGREADKRYRDLCRRLGIGMLGVSDGGEVSVIVSSVSPMPRTNPEAALAPGQGASAPPWRSRRRRRFAGADHDRLSPAGVALRLSTRWGSSGRGI